jgi:hypothetical protein
MLTPLAHSRSAELRSTAYDYANGIAAGVGVYAEETSSHFLNPERNESLVATQMHFGVRFKVQASSFKGSTRCEP